MSRLAAIEPRPAAVDQAFAASTGNITVEIKRDLDLRPADAAAIDALIAANPHVGAFVSCAWLSGLFQEPPLGVEPMLLLLRDGHMLCGIAPVSVLRARTHVSVGLLGGASGSDRVDLLSARGFETACADAFMAWVADTCGRHGYVIQLRDVPAESPLWGAIHRANGEGTRRLAFQPRDMYTLPYLDLAEARGHSVKSLEKHRRWLERRGRLRIEALQDPADALAAYESLTTFLHARWSGHGEGSTLDIPRIDRFHRRVIPLLLKDDRLRMIRLSIDMRTVAVFYGMAAGSWWGYYLAGYDREWAGRIHLGKIMLAAAIDMAAREGASEFDFLKGVEAVKYLWPVRERSSVDADVYSAHSGSQFSRAAHAGRNVTAALVKSARHLVAALSSR